jgi:hypothetical protein
MFYLKNPITTINTIYQRLQYWLKLSPFWLSLITIGTITLCLSNQLTIPAYAETQSDNRVNEILREITFCQKDGDTGEFIFGYNHFARCNRTCIQKKQENNWNNWTYVECAWTCRNDTSKNFQTGKIFRAEGYEACINRLLENKGFSKKEAIAACNNNQDFLFALPIYCYDYVEVPKNNSPVQTFFLNLLPECFNLDISATNVVGCVKSIVNVLLVIGVVFLFTSLGYLAAKSLLNNKGNFWLTIREKFRDLIVGIVLITLPVAIITLIDPSWQFLNFSQLASLNLNVRLKDPLGSITETCPGDPDKTGVIYSYAFEGDKVCMGEFGEPCDYNIKFPTLVLYNCQVFFGISRDGGHVTGYFPLFNIEAMTSDFDTFPRGGNYIDYTGPKVAMGSNGLVGIINVDRFGNTWEVSTRLWNGQDYEDRNVVYTENSFLYKALVAYYKGNWIAISVNKNLPGTNGQYQVANLGPDLNNQGNRPIEWKTFAPGNITYKGQAELITDRDFTELYVILGSGSNEYRNRVTIMKYDESSQNFQEFQVIQRHCHRPSGNLDSQGKLHFTCDDTEGNLYYYTNKSGDWVSTKITNSGVSGVLRIDQKDGIHIGYMTYSRPRKPAYTYSRDGQNWTTPIIAEDLNGQKYDYVANMAGVAFYGKRPYLLVAVEDFTFGKARDNGSRRAVFIMFGAKTQEDEGEE